jgi:hypothetical protein
LPNLSGPIAATRSFAQRWSRRLHRSYLGRPFAGTIDANLDPAVLDPAQAFTFRCNVCGGRCRATLSALDREKPTCAGCGSNVRFRAIARLVACEIFGAPIALPDLPLAMHVRGIGLSDMLAYATPLGTRLDYTNTFFDAEPRLDIVDADIERYGRCDFIIASDVIRARGRRDRACVRLRVSPAHDPAASSSSRCRFRSMPRPSSTSPTCTIGIWNRVTADFASSIVPPTAP